jgi:hypothetical protein
MKSYEYKQDELQLKMDRYYDDLKQYLFVSEENNDAISGEVVTASKLKSYEIAWKN